MPNYEFNEPARPLLRDRHILDLATAIERSDSGRVYFDDLAALLLRGPALGVEPVTIAKARARLERAAATGNDNAVALLDEVNREAGRQ